MAKAGIFLALSGLMVNQTLALEAGVVDGCLVCHKGELDLSDRNSEELAAAIQAMTDGAPAHVVPMPALGAADLLELAQALTDREQR
ncbi:MAG: hypothetical protein PVF63_07815 [Gammaproteobacteria bacterium]|jgi:hypothetical protein